MFKIKLSILLLISFITFSCTNNQEYQFNEKYSLKHISGEYDGLLLKNYLMNSLKRLNMYDPNSTLQIQASINHSTNLFITNIDNTSDREKINSTLSIHIINTQLKCTIFSEDTNVSQFFIYASGDKFLSNQRAGRKIRERNIEALVEKFMNKMRRIQNKCNE
tara:strand:- start:747 stop:1235 length:489 start_codon:yes stop_codon:yes gene_type:complete